MSDTETLRETATCARGWEPAARLVGNVRAAELATACEAGARAIDILARLDALLVYEDGIEGASGARVYRTERGSWATDPVRGTTRDYVLARLWTTLRVELEREPPASRVTPP